jgi:hypothetical protein
MFIMMIGTNVSRKQNLNLKSKKRSKPMKRLFFIVSIVFILSACDEYGANDNII